LRKGERSAYIFAAETIAKGFAVLIRGAWCPRVTEGEDRKKRRGPDFSVALRRGFKLKKAL